MYCDNYDDLPIIINEALETNGPVLVNFRVETDKCYSLVPPGNGLDEFKLYKTPINKLIYSPLLLIFVIFFIIYKNYTKNETILNETSLIHNKSKYDIGMEDLSLLKKLIIQNEINFNEVIDFYKNSSLSYGHNTRISNEKLEKLSFRLKSILKLKDQPILNKKSNVDKREKIIFLSKEFSKIKIILK